MIVALLRSIALVSLAHTCPSAEKVIYMYIYDFMFQNVVRHVT